MPKKFEPEFIETVKRLKGKDPLLDEIVQRGSEPQDSGPTDAADIEKYLQDLNEKLSDD